MDSSSEHSFNVSIINMEGNTIINRPGDTHVTRNNTTDASCEESHGIDLVLTEEEDPEKMMLFPQQDDGDGDGDGDGDKINMMKTTTIFFHEDGQGEEKSGLDCRSTDITSSGDDQVATVEDEDLGKDEVTCTYNTEQNEETPEELGAPLPLPVDGSTSEGTEDEAEAAAQTAACAALSVTKMEDDGDFVKMTDVTLDETVVEEGSVSVSVSMPFSLDNDACLTDHDVIVTNDSTDHGIEVDGHGMMIREEIPDFRVQEEGEAAAAMQSAATKALTPSAAPASASIATANSDMTDTTTTALLSTTMEQIQDGLSKLCAVNPYEDGDNATNANGGEKSLLQAWSLAPADTPNDIYGTLGTQQPSSANNAHPKLAKGSGEEKIYCDSNKGDENDNENDNDKELLRGWSHKEEQEENKKEATVADMIRKAGVAVTGGALVVAGIPMIPMPTPGGVVVVGSGMALLATEFPAAQRAIEKSKEGLSNMVGEESDEEDEDVDEDLREKASKVADLMFQDTIDDKKAAERKKQQRAIAAASTNNRQGAINLDELDEVKRKALKAAQGTKRGLKKFIRGTVLPLMDRMTPNGTPNGDRKKNNNSLSTKTNGKDNEVGLMNPTRLRFHSKDMEKK